MIKCACNVMIALLEYLTILKDSLDLLLMLTQAQLTAFLQRLYCFNLQAFTSGGT